jgi:hypothetical protein
MLTDDASEPTTLLSASYRRSDTAQGGAFSDGNSALILVVVRLRYGDVHGGKRRYPNMVFLKEPKKEAVAA